MVLLAQADLLSDMRSLEKLDFDRIFLSGWTFESMPLRRQCFALYIDEFLEWLTLCMILRVSEVGVVFPLALLLLNLNFRLLKLLIMANNSLFFVFLTAFSFCFGGFDDSLFALICDMLGGRLILFSWYSSLQTTTLPLFWFENTLNFLPPTKMILLL